jgi:integrase
MAGMGLRECDLSLALFAKLPLVSNYIRFLKFRSGGLYSGAAEKFLELVISLLRPKTGFLWQNGNLFAGKAGIAPERWEAHCEEVKKAVRKILKDLHAGNKIKRLRDPFEELRPILEQQRPLEALYELQNRIKAEVELLKVNGRPCSREFRDLVIVAMATEVPLRMGQYVRMTYREDGSGHLYSPSPGLWRVRFKAHEFKNEKGSAKTDYDVAFSEDVSALITEYLQLYRKELLGTRQLDFVFLKDHRRVKPQKLGLDSAGYPRGSMGLDLSKMIFLASRKHLGIGFRAHAIRHIVATDMIKNNLDGLRLAAYALHDTYKTVQKSYSHVKTGENHEHVLEFHRERRRQLK